MGSQTRRWALTQAKDEASAAARRNRSRSVIRFRQRPRLPPVAESLNCPAQGGEEMPKSRPPNYARHGPTTQGARRHPLAHASPTETFAEVLVGEWYPDPGTGSPVVHRQVLERNRLTEVKRRQQRWPRASTPASNGANWGSHSSQVSNKIFGAPTRFARSQDVTERLKTGWPSELQLFKDCRPPETPSENGVIQTCEPEGRDALLALEAQKQEHLATEERRLDELIRAEDRIRGLEQQNKALISTIREMIYLEKSTHSRFNRFLLYPKHQRSMKPSYRRSSSRPAERRAQTASRRGLGPYS